MRQIYSNSCTSNTLAPICLLALGLATAQQALTLNLHRFPRTTSSTTTTSSAEQTEALHNRLLDKCCRFGVERAHESPRRSCKLDIKQFLQSTMADLSLTSGEISLARESEIGEQCELVHESCCIGDHRKRNCNSGKQFAKSGSACMDVELTKETTIATESFNDCCMSCSLGLLAAKTSIQGPTNETSQLIDRCKLMTPLANSLSGQLYEQSYIECCQENLPKQSGALTEPGQPIDCARSNPCSQRCVRGSLAGNQDRCDCFVGYKLAPDGLNCVDIDECKLNQHSCNRKSELCDNVPGGFRCLARNVMQHNDGDYNNNHDNNHSHSHSQQQHSASSSSASYATHAQMVHGDAHQVTRWGSLNGEEKNLLNKAQKFVSLRLCPLNSRWNSQESRCEPQAPGSRISAHEYHPRVISSSASTSN